MNSEKEKYIVLLGEKDYNEILEIYKQRLNDLKKRIDEFINILIKIKILKKKKILKIKKFLKEQDRESEYSLIF